MLLYNHLANYIQQTMNSNPTYATKSRNPNIRPKWQSEAKRKDIRLPVCYYQIAWDVCQAIDQGIISEPEIREWIEHQISNKKALEEVKEVLVDLEKYSQNR